MTSTALPALSLFPPPYRRFVPLGLEESFPSNNRVLQGVALFWNLSAGFCPVALERVADRPGGIPLFILLPRPREVRRLRIEVLAIIEEARPHSVLPFLPRPDPNEMAWLLRDEPDCLAAELLDYLTWRGMSLDRETRRVITRTVDLSKNVHSLTALSRAVYVSRRALGRRFYERGLPVPSHWLQFCRLLHCVVKLQNSQDSLFSIGRELGYPDGFTLSNQMERLIGVRPSFARERLGWEWFVETWLMTERLSGGLRLHLRGLPHSTDSDGAVA